MKKHFYHNISATSQIFCCTVCAVCRYCIVPSCVMCCKSHFLFKTTVSLLCCVSHRPFLHHCWCNQPYMCLVLYCVLCLLYCVVCVCIVNCNTVLYYYTAQYYNSQYIHRQHNTTNEEHNTT